MAPARGGAGRRARGGPRGRGRPGGGAGAGVTRKGARRAVRPGNGRFGSFCSLNAGSYVCLKGEVER